MRSTPAESAPAPEDVPEDPPVGALENSGLASFQSGIDPLSGWVCEADVVEVEITGLDRTYRLAAACGTDRADTAGACEDADNGFGLLFNWNLLLLHADPPRDTGAGRGRRDGVRPGHVHGDDAGGRIRHRRHGRDGGSGLPHRGGRCPAALAGGESALHAGPAPIHQGGTVSD